MGSNYKMLSTTPRTWKRWSGVRKIRHMDIWAFAYSGAEYLRWIQIMCIKCLVCEYLNPNRDPGEMRK